MNKNAKRESSGIKLIPFKELESSNTSNETAKFEAPKSEYSSATKAVIDRLRSKKKEETKVVAEPLDVSMRQKH